MLEEMQTPDTEKVSPIKASTKYGLVFGLLLIIYSLVINFTNQMMNPAMSYVSWVLMIVFLAWAMLDYRKNNEGYMNYGDGLVLGTISMAISGLIAGIFSVIYMNVIDPSFSKNMLTMVREQMEKQNPNMSDEQIEMGLKFAEFFTNPIWIITISPIMYAISGILLSLIVAAFIQKKNPNPF
jgi:hypothetical protein